eukprot:10163083-Ditylum_brightwellii.AAC.1
MNLLATKYSAALNDYLVHFSVSGGVTGTKISSKEFIDVLEDRLSYQWKLEFKKEDHYLSSSTLKEFLGVCVCLEEAELQKPLRKTIPCAKKEHDNDRKKKHQDNPKLHQKRHHEPQEACSAHTPHHRTAEAPAGKEVKDLNEFIKDKIKDTIKECNPNMQAMSDFEDLSISSSNKSIQ